MSEVRDKPDYCYEIRCPLAAKGRGFALGSGPIDAPLSILFERPATDEIGYTFGGPAPAGVSSELWAKVLTWQRDEIERRRFRWPELDTPSQRRFLTRGAPVRGMSGAELKMWVLPAVGGVQLDECQLENVLHCAGKDNEYPTGNERAAAEACCSHWSRLVGATGGQGSHPPQVDVVSLHPASMLKEQGGGIVSLPLQVESFIKARTFLQAETSLDPRRGVKRVLILAGGKAAKFWLGYAEAVTKWVGHYCRETEELWKKRKERILRGLSLAAWMVEHPSGKGLRRNSNAATATKPRSGAILSRRQRKLKQSVESTTSRPSPLPSEPRATGKRGARKRAPRIPSMEVLGY